MEGEATREHAGSKEAEVQALLLAAALETEQPAQRLAWLQRALLLADHLIDSNPPSDAAVCWQREQARAFVRSKIQAASLFALPDTDVLDLISVCDHDTQSDSHLPLVPSDAATLSSGSHPWSSECAELRSFVAKADADMPKDAFVIRVKSWGILRWSPRRQSIRLSPSPMNPFVATEHRQGTCCVPTTCKGSIDLALSIRRNDVLS